MLALTLSRFAAPADLGELQTIYQQQMQTLEPRKQQILQALERSQKAPDKFEALSRAIESSTNQEQRDAGFYNMVQLALRQELAEDRIRKVEEMIEKIESSTLHDKALSLLKVREVEKLIKSANLDQAHIMSLKLPDATIRAKALRGVSVAVAKNGSKTLRSSDLLGEALAALNKADASIERSQIMIKIVSDFVTLKDYDRAFEGLQALSGSLAQLATSDFAQTGREAVPNSLFDYGGTFGRLGSIDFDKTMFLAQGIKWKELRLAAEIATCRSVLNQKGAN